MADEPDNIVIEYLRRMRTQLDRIEADVGDVKLRLTAVEMQMSAMNHRMDRFDERLMRVERNQDIIRPNGHQETH